MQQLCVFCGEDPNTPGHPATCDGRQGWIERDFDGETYDHDRDCDRLNAQCLRVWNVMRDHAWHTLPGISAKTGDPEASISARLRDFRKPRFGGYIVERRYVADGLWEYRLLLPPIAEAV